MPPRMYGPLRTMNSASTRPAFQRNRPSPPTRTIQTAAKISRRGPIGSPSAAAISSTIGAGGGGSTSAALCAWAPPPAWVIGDRPQLARSIDGEAVSAIPVDRCPATALLLGRQVEPARTTPPEKPVSVPSSCMSAMIWSTGLHERVVVLDRDVEADGEGLEEDRVTDRDDRIVRVDRALDGRARAQPALELGPTGLPRLGAVDVGRERRGRESAGGSVTSPASSVRVSVPSIQSKYVVPSATQTVFPEKSSSVSIPVPRSSPSGQA